jgi:F420-non-reducing hydrogenase small subunit
MSDKKTAAKPKVAFYWCASCGGCEESIVDLAEGILDVTEVLDIVFWPVALDFKKKDVEAMADGSITASLINGAIRTSEQEEMVHLLRRKSKVVIAYGSCAHTGGIPALANQKSREQILQYVYHDCPTVVNDAGTRPQTEFKEHGRTATLPEFRHLTRCLDQVIDVDYYLPGCAPSPALLKNAVDVLLSGKLPPKGTVLAPDVALCEECPRKDSKPETWEFEEFKRPSEVIIDPEKCILAQGVVCMGPATRAGCGALCTIGNMPCTGCYGPTSRVSDQGAKILSSIASNIKPQDDEGIERVLAGIVDPVGTFYRYGLSKCTLRANAEIMADEEGEKK